jgi:hypothetical protein
LPWLTWVTLVFSSKAVTGEGVPILRRKTGRRPRDMPGIHQGFAHGRSYLHTNASLRPRIPNE